MFFDKGGKDVCSKCKSGGSSGKCPGSTLQSPSNNCCNGTDGCKSGDCCLGCQDCDAIKFRKALEDLKLSSPCGQDLYRVLDAFIQYCREVLGPKANSTVKNAVTVAKKICTPNCKSTGGSCQCPSTSSPCKGCQHILQDPQLKVILAGGYSSSYSSSASLLSSDNNQNAAKIFLGFLPALYFGLKIIYVRSKDSLTWPDWHDISMDSYGNPSSGLAKFLQALGYDLDPLKTKKGFDIFPILGILYGSDKIFENLYNFVSKEYFSIHLSSLSPSTSPVSPSDSKSPPTTVRSMLLWLYGLRFTSGFHDLVLYCRTLSLPLDNAFHPDAVCYYLHVSCFLLPVSFISTVQHSQSHVGDFFFDADAEILKFHYPSDPSDLLDMLFEYLRKVFPALKFLSLQCNLNKDQAGWNICGFGRQCAQKVLQGSLSTPAPAPSGSVCCAASGPHGILCTSVPGHYNVHEHCIKQGVECRGLDVQCPDTTEDATQKHPSKDAHTNGKCTAAGPCPHPLLMFLIDGSDSQSKPQASSYSLFKLPKDSSVPPMGFSKENLPTPGRHGKDLYAVLKVFCDDGFYPLTRLLKFLTRVSRTPPETLGELYAFFMRFTESSLLKDFADYASEEPGRYSGDSLTNAMKDLYGSHSGSHSDLKSLYDCSTSTCGKYLYPLTYNAYHGFIEGFLGTYLSWICHLGPKFYSDFKDFQDKAQGKFSSSSCCTSCNNIVKCPCAHPFLYSYGFTFWSPNSLNSGKKCSDFITQLGLVVNGHLFKNLLRVIDEFIWHIRLPFIYAFLYIWILVISYFYYVQFYKLDLLHIDSHLHLPRSFKILPSTLFSDASSKLKDLSYFTL
ncbi:variant erythrocyte surface antigen-1 family protein [Babesia divergens]|uniref:Variant erythrocyte surface antigen-1 family protein n=1 Tax=Babesia divergens TaxID=32595 RepID=A0AAD9GBG3_BABDI|nr:variant erythrocyte surface antigen-1 family protein [Babesia divergens]